MQSNESTLRAVKLMRKFDSKIVVENATFQVKKGEIVGLLGPNGAGKTTSFYMTVGLLKPTAGHVYVDDIEITSEAIHHRARRGIGYLPQNASVFRKLSVEDNITAIMEVWGVPKSKRKARLEQLLEQFSIVHIRKSLGISLSGGERRRLEIARTLVLEPAFLLLDEPFAGIDPVTVGEVQKLISTLVQEQNLGILITDHNVRETLGICNRAYVLAAGKILAEGSPTEIINNETVKSVYLGENFAL